MQYEETICYCKKADYEQFDTKFIETDEFNIIMAETSTDAISENIYLIINEFVKNNIAFSYWDGDQFKSNRKHHTNNPGLMTMIKMNLVQIELNVKYL